MKVTLQAERREILGHCQDCRSADTDTWLLGPDGFVHAAAANGTTLCGKTTGKRWWKL